MKKWLAAGAFALALTMLGACTAKDMDTGAVASGQEDTQSVTIEHELGVITVEGTPERLAVFDIGMLENVNRLEIDAEIAAPLKSLTSALAMYEDAAPAGGIKEPDLEALYEFAPDLIIISGRQADFYDALSEIAPVWYVKVNAESYMEDFAANVMQLAALFGKEDLAGVQLGEIEARTAEIKAQTADMQERALILLTNDGNISAYGSGSRFGIIHDVFGVPVADPGIDVSTHGQEVGYEYIAMINPDLIYVVDRTAVVAGTNDASDTLKNELVDGTRAGQTGGIVYLDAETWYLSGGGLISVGDMADEILQSLS